MKTMMEATLVGSATFQGHLHWPGVPQPSTCSHSLSQLITRASQSLLGPEDLETSYSLGPASVGLRIVREEQEEGKGLLR